MRKLAIKAALGAVIINGVCLVAANADTVSAALDPHSASHMILAQAATPAKQPDRKQFEQRKDNVKDKAANLTDDQRQQFKAASPADKKDFIQNQQEKRNKLMESMTPEERQKFRNADPDAQSDYIDRNRQESRIGGMTDEQRAKMQNMTPEQRRQAIQSMDANPRQQQMMEHMTEEQRERFKNATPEQREQFINNMKNREGQQGKGVDSRKEKLMSHMTDAERERFKTMNAEQQRSFLQTKYQQYRAEKQSGSTPQ